MNEGFFKTVRLAVAILLSLLLAFIIISLVSKNPLRTMGLFLFGPLKNVRYLGNVIELTIPLIFAGLSTAILFQANLFNLGAEGIFYFSGLTAAFVAVLVPIANPFLHVSAAIAAGAVMGMVVALVPGYLRAKWNASELVSSLMMNSILAGVGLYLLNNVIRDKDLTEIASLKLAPSALLPRIIPRTRIHLGLVICLCFVAGVYLFSRRHRIGYLLRMFGFNHRFVEYSGFSSFSMIIIAHLLAGFIAGVGGSVEVLGMYDRFRWASLPGLGFDGALVAMLARNKPLPVLGSALFLAYIRTGADIMARQADVPAEMVSIVQAVIILLISADRFLHGLEERRILKKALA
ncbi:ABC transporter permease [Sediminispirochaeta bajacaliforniensis]|uniref:ABC transporter permease n=1 Tax=Sediminispirochaeta bajacaliforniensis TaxID=148 RepID=UPI00036C87AA|nr:ABC transporter permease [Sediminispirochaeta bajacaliforniensis]